MKKLNRNEAFVIAQEVRNLVNEAKVKDVREKSKKDKDAISYLKLIKEKKALNDRLRSLNDEIYILRQKLVAKYNNEFGFGEDVITGEVRIWCASDQCVNLHNKIVLMGIDKDLKVNELIAELVKEYSK
jgi:predicted  nucleic acid-binding Zn-ribbon protein